MRRRAIGAGSWPWLGVLLGLAGPAGAASRTARADARVDRASTRSSPPSSPPPSNGSRSLAVSATEQLSESLGGLQLQAWRALRAVEEDAVCAALA
jgi:hypothetical protein